MYLEGEGGKPRRWSTGVPVGRDKRVSKREATRIAEIRAAEVAGEVFREVDGTSEASIDAVGERLIASKTTDGRRARAVDAIAFNLDKHVKPYFGDTRDVRTIRRSDLEAFKAELKSAGYAPTSINNALTAIRQALKYACNVDESIEAVPYVGNVPVPKRSAVGMPITPAQAHKYLANIKDTDAREFNLFLLETGLRVYEALAVRWEWIDWKRRELHIPGEVRKGGKEQRAPTALTEAAIVMLRAREARPRQPSKNRVFFQLKGGRKGSRNYDTMRRDAAKKAGIQGFRHHDARHSRATWMGASGATAIELRDAFNWETLAMVSRYTHPERERLHELAERVTTGVDTGAGRSGSRGRDRGPSDKRPKPLPDENRKGFKVL